MDVALYLFIENLFKNFKNSDFKKLIYENQGELIKAFFSG